MKFYLASFNRAETGATSKLRKKMADKGLLTIDDNEADYIICPGDRTEMMDYALDKFRSGKKIIHLWAGEISQGCHDEVYRHSISLMSCVWLCTNEKACETVMNLLESSKKYEAYKDMHVVGNIMLDNMEIDESEVPDYKYDLVLYNPPTALSDTELYNDMNSICTISGNTDTIWIEPNGDHLSELVWFNTDSMPRPKFLGLLKNCRRFITNSSCAYYEAPFVGLKPDQIIMVGERNKERSSKYSDMTIPNASDNIIKILESL